MNLDMEAIKKAHAEAKKAKREVTGISTPSASGKDSDLVRACTSALIHKVSENLEAVIISAFETGTINLAPLGLKAVELQEIAGTLESDIRGSKTRGAARDAQHNAILNGTDACIARAYASGNRSQATYFYVPEFSKLPEEVKELLHRAFSALDNVCFPALGQLKGEAWTPAVRVRFLSKHKAVTAVTAAAVAPTK